MGVVLFFTAVAALLVLAAAAAWPGMYAVWCRIMASTADLSLWRVMRRQGIRRADVAGREPELARAAFRCIACRNAATCDAWLASGGTEGVESFCPNHALLAELRARHLLLQR